MLTCVLLGHWHFSPFAVAEEKLILAFSALPPYSSIDQHGRPAGLEIDILQLIAKDASITIEPVKCHFNACLKLIERGEADIISGILKTPDRQAYMQYLTPSYYAVEANITFYKKADRNIQLRDYQGLSQYSIAHINGAKYFPYFDENMSLSLLVADSEEVLLRLLLADRVDLVASMEETFDLFLSQQQAGASVNKVAFSHRARLDAFMALSNKSPYKSKAVFLSTILQKHVHNGNVARLLSKYNIPGVVQDRQ